MSRETVTALLALAALFFAATAVTFFRQAERIAAWNRHLSKSGRLWAGLSLMLAIYCGVAAVLVAVL